MRKICLCYWCINLWNVYFQGTVNVSSFELDTFRVFQRNTNILSSSRNPHHHEAFLSLYTIALPQSTLPSTSKKMLLEVFRNLVVGM